MCCAVERRFSPVIGRRVDEASLARCEGAKSEFDQSASTIDKILPEAINWLRYREIA